MNKRKNLKILVCAALLTGVVAELPTRKEGLVIGGCIRAGIYACLDRAISYSQDPPRVGVVVDVYFNSPAWIHILLRSHPDGDDNKVDVINKAIDQCAGFYKCEREKDQFKHNTGFWSDSLDCGEYRTETSIMYKGKPMTFDELGCYDR